MSNVTRRNFVHTAAGAAAFTIVPRHVLGRGHRAPSDTLNVACIGVGGMGRNDVRGMEDENLYALCDVDLRAADDAFRTYRQAKQYRDYRVMLEREAKNIDAVTVTTPDHSHAAAAIMALGLGKHVYCQKPLARTIGEVHAIVDAATKTKTATQMGNQGHAGDGTRQMREWIEAGVIGTVREVHFWTNRPIWPQAIERPLEAYHPPPTLDWNLWLGPAPERPYAPAYAPFRWRGWWDFGTGALGDMACHIMDAAFWILDLRDPAWIAPESTTLFGETAPKASRITYHFPARGTRPEVTVVWRDGGLLPPAPVGWPKDERWPPAEDGGQLWIGSDGAMVAGTYGGDPRLVDPMRDEELKANPPAMVYPRVKSVYDEWIAACKGGPPAGSNFRDHAGPLTEMVLLGNLALRADRTLTFDENGMITNADIPKEWYMSPYRDGWKL